MMRRITDTLVNLVSQLATGKSKTAADAFVMKEIGYAELSSIYRGDWVGRKFIDTPVFDMLREWRHWQATPQAIEMIETAEDVHQVKAKVSKAARLGRLFGGGAIVVGADVRNPEAPLTPRSVGKGGLKHLTVLSRYQFNTPEIDTDPRSPTFGRPTFYEINTTNGAPIRLHPSRVIPFFGADRLEPDLVTQDGWSDSLLLSAYDAIHNRALAETGTAELIHEAKVDVIMIPNLGSQLGTIDGTRILAERFSNANTIKSINNMLLLDDQEKWERKQTSFSHLPDMIDRYLQIVCAAADIPATRLLGVGAKGLGNSGESDLRNYYDSLAGKRAETIGPQLAYLDQILWIDATGSIPRDAYAEWAPMWQMTPKEKADIAKSRAETSKIYAELAIIPEDALTAGVQNQLIEDGVYPGLEAAIATLRSSGNGASEDPEEDENDASAGRSVGDARNQPLAGAQSFGAQPRLLGTRERRPGY